MRKASDVLRATALADPGGALRTGRPATPRPLRDAAYWAQAMQRAGLQRRGPPGHRRLQRSPVARTERRRRAAGAFRRRPAYGPGRTYDVSRNAGFSLAASRSIADPDRISVLGQAGSVRAFSSHVGVPGRVSATEPLRRWAMVFSKQLREPIAKGEITCSVRIWRSARVKVGGRYRVGPGAIRVTSVREIGLEGVTPETRATLGLRGRRRAAQDGEARLRREGLPRRLRLRRRGSSRLMPRLNVRSARTRRSVPALLRPAGRHRVSRESARRRPGGAQERGSGHALGSGRLETGEVGGRPPAAERAHQVDARGLASA